MGKINLNKIAFIGGGAMAKAIIKGIIGGGLVAPEQIMVGEPTEAHAAALHADYGVKTTTDNKEAVRDADLVIFAVKPQVAPVALTPDLIACFKKDAWVLSIMGSVTLEQLHAYAPGFPVVRTMPNTPLACGAGMTAICCDAKVTGEMKETAGAIFSSCGEIEYVDEKALDAITAISGCGPRIFLRDYRCAGRRRRACRTAACARYQAGSTDDGRQRQAVHRKRSASGTAARPGDESRRHDDCRYSCAGEPWRARCLL